VSSRSIPRVVATLTPLVVFDPQVQFDTLTQPRSGTFIRTTHHTERPPHGLPGRGEA
jgi:hypothetical protein